MYIMYGPPDEIDDHSSGGTYDRPIEEGGGTTSTFPFIEWTLPLHRGRGHQHKNRIRGHHHVAANIRMTMDPSEKDALTYVPGAGLTLAEQMGMADKSQRFTRTDGTTLGTGSKPLPESMNEFTRLEQFANLQKPPGGQVQGSGGGGQLQHPIQQSAVQGAGGLHPDHGFHRADHRDHQFSARICSSSRRTTSQKRR